jgi:hypothetical protein
MRFHGNGQYVRAPTAASVPLWRYQQAINTVRISPLVHKNVMIGKWQGRNHSEIGPTAGCHSAERQRVAVLQGIRSARLRVKMNRYHVRAEQLDFLDVGFCGLRRADP